MAGDGAKFRVPWEQRFFGSIMERFGGACRAIGNLETRVLQEKLERVRIDRPIYIAGVARSGSTVLLEKVTALPGMASHQYRDFPFIQFPAAWNRYLSFAPRGTPAPVERAHGDRILVTPESPEAMEEILWVAFFPRLHDPRVSNVLGADTENPAFEEFYRDHIRKMLLVRRGKRYVAKGNYNLTRLGYLLRIFPDARFVIPVRHPVMHCASLLKQHRLFLRAEKDDPAVSHYMRRVGHLEFGSGRTPVNAGDTARTESVLGLWSRGEDARGTARYWNDMYSFVMRALAASPALAAASLVVRFEDLCTAPEETLGKMFAHCGLPVGEHELKCAASGISSPSYYKPGFTDAEMRAVLDETQEARALLNYGERDPLMP